MQGSTAQKHNLVHISIRLHPATVEIIRDLSQASGVPLSEVIRAAMSLYRYAGELTELQKLAVVDLSDRKPGGYYQVDRFVITELG